MSTGSPTPASAKSTEVYIIAKRLILYTSSGSLKVTDAVDSNYNLLILCCFFLNTVVSEGTPY